MMKYEVASRHLAEDHMDRAVYILMNVGLGNVVREFPRENAKGKTWHCITDTGVLLIKSYDKKKVVTMFNCTVDRLYAYYKEIGQNPPQRLCNTCRKLEKRMKNLQ